MVSHDFLFMYFFFNVFEFIITTVPFLIFRIYNYLYLHILFLHYQHWFEDIVVHNISTLIEGNFVYSSINGFHTLYSYDYLMQTYNHVSLLIS